MNTSSILYDISRPAGPGSASAIIRYCPLRVTVENGRFSEAGPTEKSSRDPSFSASYNSSKTSLPSTMCMVRYPSTKSSICTVLEGMGSPLTSADISETIRDPNSLDTLISSWTVEVCAMVWGVPSNGMENFILPSW